MRDLDTYHRNAETFVVLARLGSVGKTAEAQLHGFKASVSRRISALEKSVGKLFCEGSRRKRIDSAWCVFLEKIQPLFRAF